MLRGRVATQSVGDADCGSSAVPKLPRTTPVRGSGNGASAGGPTEDGPNLGLSSVLKELRQIVEWAASRAAERPAVGVLGQTILREK
jgi:hypothetical protein